MQLHWVSIGLIETSVGEFDKEVDALVYFKIIICLLKVGLKDAVFRNG